MDQPNQAPNSPNRPPPGLDPDARRQPPKTPNYGLKEGPGNWDLTWLTAPRTLEVPPATHPPRRHKIRGQAYEYTKCENPPLSLNKWPPRLCQHVHPKTTTRDMLPFLTHPNEAPPVAVIPRAASDDRECSFCGDFPVLHGVRKMCPFHFYYLLGCTTREQITAMNLYRDQRTGRYLYEGPDHLDKLRDEVVRISQDRAKQKAKALLPPENETKEDA
ncbi:hypothetical protein F4805DRAFT_431585 [Annulohypoxylon moriforme]|nr:hypothetical protein F4805DRAFT_431585 [Annulohypoxylon moriforme]